LQIVNIDKEKGWEIKTNSFLVSTLIWSDDFSFEC